MSRNVNEEEYTAKSNQILDVAQQLVFTKGYEKMSIQDILNALGMSKGAFYHYFDSKAALLEAYIERGQDEIDEAFHTILADPNLSAVDKFQKFFSTLDQFRQSQQVFIAELARVWFADENAIVREKIDEVIVARRAPLLNAIVRQGVEEGVFTTPYPEQAGVLILAIARGMGNKVLKLMLSSDPNLDESQKVNEIVETSCAMAEAIESILNSSNQILHRPNSGEVQVWLTMLNQNTE